MMIRSICNYEYDEKLAKIPDYIPLNMCYMLSIYDRDGDIKIASVFFKISKNAQHLNRIEDKKMPISKG